MSARLKRNLDLLRVLKKANKKQRTAILETGNKDLILCLCEVIDNILAGTVKLTPKQKKELTKYKSLLRQLIDKKIDLNQKRNLIIQKGGFLPAILGPALGLAATIIGQLI